MDEVGIPAPEARYRAYPHEFSGGMQQLRPNRDWVGLRTELASGR